MGLGRWVIGGATLVALGWTACGGDSFTGGEGAGGNASGGSSASGGLGGTAGSGGSAGNVSGGTGAAGSGAVGNGGSGAAGSGGTGGIPTEYTTCGGPGQCILVPSNCCGYCSEPVLDGFLAINYKLESTYFGERCATIDCPSCITSMPGNFTAVCRAGTCTAVDVYDEDSLTGCERNEDCQLRWGAGCCEGCAPSPDQLIAVKHNAIEQTQCGEGTPCPACPGAPYPAEASAECINKKCSIVYAN